MTVGSTEGTRGVDTSSDNPDQVAGFSSRGTLDGRIKPEVLAPGTWILSTRKTKPNLASDSYIGLYNQNYGYMSGTSMSTALTAGSLALLRQYFQAKGVTPNASLLKAALIFGTQKLPGVSASDQGFGRVNVENTLVALENGNLFYQDNPGLQTGETVTYTYTSNGQPFRVVMAYSDYPKTPGVGKDLVNDLDLKVIGPDNKGIYWGNGYMEGDRLNNVEEVIVYNPEPGQTYTIEVAGHNIVHGPQPFSIVFGDMTYSGTVAEINNEEIKFSDGKAFKLDEEVNFRVISGEEELPSAALKDIPPGAEAYLSFGPDGEVTHIEAIYITMTSKIMSKEGARQLTIFDGTRWTMADQVKIFVGENKLNWAELPIESEVKLTVNPVSARVWR
nr:S8 family serine peptidase [Desulforamulus aquiferis]